MKTYQDVDGSLHELPDEVDPESIPNFPKTAVRITKIEADAIRAAQTPTPDPKLVISAQIAQIERETLMNRATRELMLGIAEKEGAALGLTPEQLYVANVAYRSVKDVDSRIAALRAQIGEL